MVNESPWFKKTLSDIRKTDKARREMEQHFSYDSLDKYKELNEQEAQEAVELLKFGLDTHFQGDSLIIEYEGEKFKVAKEALREKLGTDQYNWFVNNIEEVPEKDDSGVEDADDDDSGVSFNGQKEKAEPPQAPVQAQNTAVSASFTLPDGREVPQAVAPMFLFTQAMERAISVYMGGTPEGGSLYPASAPIKAKSKTTNEILRSISELQQQVLLIEDEKQRAVAGGSEETDALRAEKEELEAKQKKAKDTIADLEKELLDIKQKHTFESQRTAEKLKQAADVLESKDKELQDAVSAKNGILEQKEKEIKSLKSDYENKLVDLQNEYEEKIKSLNDEKETLNADKQALSEEKQKERDAIEKEYQQKFTDLSDKHSKEIDRIRKEMDSASDKAKKQAQDKYQAQLKELQKQKENAEKELDRMKDSSKNLQEQLKELRSDVYTDILTGVKNEKALNNAIERHAPKLAGRVLILGTKQINAEQGFDTGNAVIGAVAEGLENLFPKRVYRTLGDQFVVLPDDRNTDEDSIYDKITELSETLAQSGITIAFGTGSGDNALEDAKAYAEQMREEAYADDEDSEEAEAGESDEADETEEEASEDSDEAENAEDESSTDTSSGSDKSSDDDDDDDARLAETLMEGEDL